MTKVPQINAARIEEPAQYFIPYIEQAPNFPPIRSYYRPPPGWVEGQGFPAALGQFALEERDIAVAALWGRVPAGSIRRVFISDADVLVIPAKSYPSAGTVELVGKRSRSSVASNWAPEADSEKHPAVFDSLRKYLNLDVGRGWQIPQNMSGLSTSWINAVGIGTTLETDLEIDIAGLFEKDDFESFKHEFEAMELTRIGRSGVADRLRYLRSLCETEQGESPLDYSSVRNLRGFLTSEKNVPDPRLYLTAEGLARAEWRTNDGGIVALEFRKDGWIQFAGVTPNLRKGDDRGTIHGVFKKRGVLSALKSFLPKLIGV